MGHTSNCLIINLRQYTTERSVLISHFLEMILLKIWIVLLKVS